MSPAARSLFVAILLAAGLSSSALSASSAAGPPGQAGGTSILGGLDAVDAAPGGQVWAVGFRGVEPYATLAQRWDGARWQRVETPSPGHDSELLEVAAISDDDAWAVGYFSPLAGGEATLIVHWDGTSWTRIPSHVPRGVGISSQLYDVDARSGSDVWAVGTVTTPRGSSRTLIMHWDGSSWSRIPSPNPRGGSSVLLAVAALSADDVWAVGYGPKQGPARPGLAEHWNGRHWQVVPVDTPPGKTLTTLNAITAQSPDRVWAVGRIDTGNESETVAELWNGHRWSIVSTPSPPGGGGSALNGVASDGDEAWAVGGAGASTLILHDTGSGWRRVHSPTFAPSSVFTAALSVGTDDAWAVGFHGLDQTRIRLLSEHWDGRRWVEVQQ